MITLHFIHGFLGFSSDWDIFKEDFKKYNSVFYSISKYMTSSNKQENSSFILWASNFNKSALKNKVNQKNILIGYSLGGRLALHTLIESNRWDAAIIISANPGLKSESEKLARIANDNSWANRFQNENWNDVINAWNSQGVFSNMQNTLSREEKLFNKTEVVNILKEFSLGKQEDLREKIKALNIPILWIAGEKDTKFVKVANEMQELSKNIDLKIIKDAGHRVPWENSNDFKKACLDFISKI